MRGLASSIVALSLVLAAPRGAAQDEPTREPARELDAATYRDVVVPLRGGKLDVAELGRVLLDAYGFAGDELPAVSVQVDLAGIRGRLVLAAARELLLDTVRFRRSAAALHLRIDRERAREVRRDLRRQLTKVVGLLGGEDLLARDYVLTCVPEAIDPKRPLVVMVHGVESSAAVWTELTEHLGMAIEGVQLATFAYPNDDAIDPTARALAAELHRLRPQPVAIVAHSMGGLIARAVVEDPELDPGNVERLILIGTPNQGSRLAGLRFALEAAHLLRGTGGAESFGRALVAGFRANMLDGLGEAGGDLLPGSVFMTKLAARQRNPHVAYHLVLGSRGIVGAADLEVIRSRARSWLDDGRLSRFVAPKVDGWLADLDEVVDERGDGAVSLARGRLAGVACEIVHLDHIGLIRRRGLLGTAAPDEPHPVFELVTRWLR